MNTDAGVQRAIEQGERNREAIELAQNWCGHLQTSVWGGVGLVEQMTGLPIGSRRFTCAHARDDGLLMYDAAAAAVRFYRQNCVGCAHRQPVRLPNLLELVAREETANVTRNRERVRVEELAREAFAAREERRRNARALTDDAGAGLVDLITRLDADPQDVDGEILVETARAAPDRFTPAVQELLFDLAAAGGDVRVTAALRALGIVSGDRPRLVRSALNALGRGDALGVAAEIATVDLRECKPEEVEPAVRALIHLAAPDYPTTFRNRKEENPEPLRRTYRVFRGVVAQVLRSEIRTGREFFRRDACEALSALLPLDPELGVEFVDDLVRAMLRDGDEERYAEAAARRALAEALSHRPHAVDIQIRRSENVLGLSDRALLFGVFDQVLRQGGDRISPEAAEVVLRHIVEALSTPNEEERISKAESALGLAARHWPAAVARHADELLGAAALLAERVDAADEELLPAGTPEFLRLLELQNRRGAAHHALQETAKVLGALAPSFPESVAATYLETLAGLGDAHERLRAALVEGAGEIGRTQEGLSLAVPVLYSGLMHGSPAVRAAAARAYGEVVGKHESDLPDLVHETFLLLLTDPVIAVHKAAIEALRFHNIPDPYRSQAAELVWTIVQVYAATRPLDRVLAHALDAFIGLREGVGRLSRVERGHLVLLLRRMEPNAAWDVARFAGEHLVEEDGYSDFLLELIVDPRTYSFRIDGPVAALAEVPLEQIRRIAAKIPGVAAVARGRTLGDFNQADPTVLFLDMLGRAGAWAQAEQIAAAVVEEFADNEWDRGRRLYYQLWHLAAGIEFSTTRGDDAVQRGLLAEWAELVTQIEAFDAKNAKPDGFPFDI